MEKSTLFVLVLAVVLNILYAWQVRSSTSGYQWQLEHSEKLWGKNTMQRKEMAKVYSNKTKHKE